MPETEAKASSPTSPYRADWDAIEPHWRAGIASLAQLERDFGVSRQAITKHFAKRKIGRDLAAKIKGEAATIVQRATVAGGAPVAVPEPPADGRQTDRETVGINARVQANVILGHRSTIQRAQRVTDHLLTELESQTFDAGLYRQLDRLMREAAANGKVAMETLTPLLALYQRTTSSSARTENMRKLSEILKTLVELERRVHGISDDTPVDPSEGIREAAESGLEELKARFKRHLALVPPAPPRAA